MATLHFWDEECLQCHSEIDTYEDEYYLLDDGLLCGECYDERCEAYDDDQKSVKDILSNRVDKWREYYREH